MGMLDQLDVDAVKHHYRPDLPVPVDLLNLRFIGRSRRSFTALLPRVVAMGEARIVHAARRNRQGFESLLK
jgi:hypothetical protein